MKKRLVILGSTGSIGKNVLDVVSRLPDRFEVTGLSARRNADELLRQAARFGVRTVALSDAQAADAAARMAPAGVRVLRGPEGVEALAAGGEADMVLSAIVGLAGLRPALAAIESGRTLALATKEALVAAGELVMKACERKAVRLLPVDSEHSAIFQCLNGRPAAGVKKIILTASGGPFACRPDVDFAAVNAAQALEHPRWSMGPKVTIDSATMMNKGLELIEAHWLFGLPMDRLEVLLHPESVVHSLVEFEDGALVAQLSVSDMRFAIQFALTWPERVSSGLPSLDLAALGTLRFSQPDERRFPALALARRAAAAGGVMPAVMNAANETAVERFLDGRLDFPGIWRVVEEVMASRAAAPASDLAAILEADAAARRAADEIIARRTARRSISTGAGRERI